MFTESETIQRLCNLPRLNPNVTRLLTLSVTPDATLEAFDELFSSDPSLAAELLRVSNSAEFGQMSRVISISRALLLLGEERVRKLSVTIAMSQYTRHCAPRAELHALWSHSLASGVLAEEIGRTHGFPPEYLYTAGLTHDLGRAGLLLIGQRHYLKVLSADYADMTEAHRLEKALLGVTHCDAGLYLAQTWLFPESLRAPIAHHHDVLTPESDELVRIVQSACFIACELGYPEIPNCPARPPEAMLAAELGLWPEKTESLRAAVQERLPLF
jgi:HD-like signal output (HDOD) protein